MDMKSINTYDLYHDIQKRTGGEIYLGVVGPVRTGKSTFVKRFMDLLVIPEMKEEYEIQRTRDELPQSSGGKTITTTEPKFIPKEAIKISLGEDVEAAVRLIDCVGYMVEGATGHMEEDEERMVKTPWFAEEIPFTRAAEVGTGKVITDHSTIGLIVTTDGSFGDIPGENYKEAELRCVEELKGIGKPFLILYNTVHPYAKETLEEVAKMEETYGAGVLPVNILQLKKEDIHSIMQKILYEFPLSRIEFFMPGWVRMLDINHPLKADIVKKIRENYEGVSKIKDMRGELPDLKDEYIRKCKIDEICMANGCVKATIDVEYGCYYEMLSDMTGEEITGESDLMKKMKEYTMLKKEYGLVRDALNAVKQKGYGVVMPEKNEIRLDKPQLIRHGNKYGVKIRAFSPSLHLIKANVETEIAPIVGTEEQANDLISYLAREEGDIEGIWATNIFGKSVEQLVNEGIGHKLSQIGEESQVKLQDTMQKIVNEGNGGMVCIII